MGLLRIGEGQKPINQQAFDVYRKFTESQKVTSQTFQFPQLPSSENFIQADASVQGTVTIDLFAPGLAENNIFLITDLFLGLFTNNAVGAGCLLNVTSEANVNKMTIFEIAPSFNWGTINQFHVTKVAFYMRGNEKLRIVGKTATDTLIVNILGYRIK